MLATDQALAASGIDADDDLGGSVRVRQQITRHVEAVDRLDRDVDALRAGPVPVACARCSAGPQIYRRFTMPVCSPLAICPA
jgi:hypothetical protein